MSVLRIAWWALASIGLGVSALLLYEYAAPAAQFCGDGGGCDLVRHSAYASLFGVPTPAFGVVFFAGALVVSTVPRWRALLLVFAAAGALSAIGFIVLQVAVIEAFCKYCLVADGAALALAALAVPLFRSREESETRWSLAAPIAAAGVALPILLGITTSVASDEGIAGELPHVIAREQRADVATIVEFLDFQCPYCRKQHETMKQVLADYNDKVRMVYKHVPMSRHKYARGAAAAACCAEEQGKLFELADELFTAEDLTERGCERLAERIGLDMDAYRSCLASDRPEQRLTSDLEDAIAVEVRGLPTFYVGHTRMQGLKDAGLVRGAIDHALANLSSSPADHQPGAHQ